MYKIDLCRFVLIMLLGVIGFLWAQAPDSSWLQTENISDDFDSLNVSFLGNWPFADSRAIAYDNSRQLAFLGSGGGIYILDISTPVNPIKVSEKIHTRGYVVNLVYDITLQRLYIVNGTIGVEIWDVVDPANPLKLGEWEAPYNAYDVSVNGSYAYLIDCTPFGHGGLHILDISNPSNPYELGYCSSPGASYGIFVQGEYAYLAEGNHWFRVINVSNPTMPYEEGYCETPAVAEDVFVDGNYAYVATGPAGLVVIDISRPATPYIIGICDTPGSAVGVYVQSGYAYVADHAYGGLRIIDIVDPEEPVEVGYYDSPGCAWSLYTSGSYVYVADHVDGLRIIDVTQPSNPFEVGYYNARSSVLDICLSSSYAYIADRGAGLRVIDISTMSNPYEIGNCDIPSEAYGIAKSGSYAYIADYNTGLHVIDVSTPVNPIHIGFCPLPGHARKVFIKGQYAYVAAADAGFHIVNISSPINPIYIGGYNTPFPGSGMDIFVVNNYAYLADSLNGLRIFDISTPSNPVPFGQCSTPDAALGIFVQNDYAYVAAAYAGLRVINISNPENPFEVGYYVTDGQTRDVFTEGFCVYISYHGDEFSGIYAFDISTPTHPVQVGHYNTNYWAAQPFSITVDGSYIYSGTYRSGLQIFNSEFLSIETDDPLALAYSGNRHLVREPGTENLHMVYTNNEKVTYRYSNDGGDNWTVSNAIAEGRFPAIDLDRQKNPCVVWTLDNSLFFSIKEQTEWIATEYTFGTLQPSHPCVTITNPNEMDVDSVHILVRLYDNLFSSNYIREIAFSITNPQLYQMQTLDGSSGANMIDLDFPSIARDFNNTLHASWVHGDTVYYGTRPEGQNWNIVQNPFDPEGVYSAHPFIETYGDSVFVVWQNEVDGEVYRGRRHLFRPFSWENLSQTSTTPSIFPVNASGIVTTFIDKSSMPDEYDVFWRTEPADPLHNLSNSGFVESIHPQTCLRILDEQEPLCQYCAWQEGNEAPYEIKFLKTEIIPDRNIQSSSAYFTSIPGDSMPSLYLIERDSFINSWQIPVDIGVQRVIYEFPLVSPYFYKAKIIAYHEFQGQRQMRVDIDGSINTTVNYNAAHPETLELWIPPELYMDSSVIIKLHGIDTGLTVGPINIYRYECGPGGKMSGGTMTQDNQPSSGVFFTITPNPFHKELNIRCQITDVSLKISLKAYDVTGRLVNDIYKGSIKGNNILKWNGEDENGRPVAQGIYFIRVENLYTDETLCKKVLKIE
jgi:hypothetical protein